MGPRALSTVGSMICLGVAAAAFAPHDRFFLENFLWFWFPPAAVVVVTALIGAAPGGLAGTGLALVIYLVGYHAWARESLAWLGYLFAMPGAAIGAIAARSVGGQPNAHGRSFVINFLFVAGGLAAASGVLCSTVMYCGS